jgi:hypothetical protein
MKELLILFIILLGAAILINGICVVLAYRRGICDGRKLQAVREFMPYEVRAKKKGRIL